MSRRQMTRTCVVLALAVLAAACSGPPTTTTVATAPIAPTPAATAGPSIHLEPCRLGSMAAECGTFAVYENRAARSGRMIALRVAVIKAQGESPAPDPIFYLAGGPGGSAVEDGARQQFPRSLSQNHDLVFVDQRGTGGSNRVLVSPDSPDLAGMTPEEADATVKALVAKFLDEIDMDPQYYTTALAMDDLDDVRQALGYGQINLFGGSYGATAAQYYLRQHEEHVRTVTLLGGSLLDTSLFELWAKNGQRALDLILEHCAAGAACRDAYPDLRQEFAALLERLAVEPVTVTYGGRQPGTITYTPDYLAPVIRLMTKDTRYIRTLPHLIHHAYQENDWQGFTQFILAEGNVEWWGSQVVTALPAQAGRFSGYARCNHPR